MSEERILVVVLQLKLSGVARTVGDLVFTTRQVFLARTAGNLEHSRAFGVIAAAAAAQRIRSASQQLQAQPVETILAMADPRTRFEYRELHGITVNLGGFFSSPSIELVPRHGKRLKLLGERAAFEDLAAAVPFLIGVGAPISIR